MKYPRTSHLYFSPGASNDDKIAKDASLLIVKPIVITEKMDGGNACLHSDGVFARTHASIPTHPSFDHLKSLQSTIKHNIPKNYQFFGENCFAKHAIFYNKLPSYFLLFGIRDLNKMGWLSWEEVETWATKLNLHTVPILFKGECLTEKDLKLKVENLMKEPSKCGGEREGVVVRIQASFEDDIFTNVVQKSVRKGHVAQGSEHWLNQKLVKNIIYE